MKPASILLKRWYLNATTFQSTYLLRSFFAGLLVPCGFSPFHLPGLAILGLALFFTQLQRQTLKQSFNIGFVFGLGFWGLGISWIYVSIHEYGHLVPPISALITCIFVAYLALFTALMACVYQQLAKKVSLLFNCFLFSALWCLSEWLRSTFLTGFPWLLIGIGQIDTPLKHLLPFIGVFGVGFVACLSAALLAAGTQTKRSRYPWIIAFVALLISPCLLKNAASPNISKTPISVGVIQANISMRDKWDETIFWKLLDKYDHYIQELIGKKQLIVMPESAIPLPANYISDFLEALDEQAKHLGSAILLGIPQPTTNETEYYNTISSLGLANGSYLKQHLVPFGEFIPTIFQKLFDWLELPPANMKSGKAYQSLMTVNNHPLASLICYETAYPALLRKQLPRAEWIVSISDDGWFGHSLAMYQQLQMAQVLSLQTGRYQIVANNDGLSSIIDTQGNIVSSLPAFSAGILNAEIYPATGSSLWVYCGDTPILLISLLISILALSYLIKQRRLNV